MAEAHASQLSSACSALFCTLSEPLSPRLRSLFKHLCWGWLLCLGRPTVTNVLRAAPGKLDRHWTCAHRFFSKSRWLLEALFEVLVKQILDPLVPSNEPWIVAIDDTTARKYGQRVAFAGLFRDAARSTLDQPAFHWSHNWVLVCLMVPRGKPGKYMHIPMLARLFKKDKDCKAGEFRSHGQLAGELLARLREWLPHRRIVAVADPLYVSRDFLNGLPERTAFVGKLKSHAALYKLPERKAKRGPGAPRKKGARLPNLSSIAANARFKRCRVQLHGCSQTLFMHSFDCLWYGGCSMPVRVVLVRDPQKKEGHLQTFFSTRVELSPKRIVELYAARWGIEEAIREVKQSLGFDSVQSWSAKAVTRQAALALVLHAAVQVAHLRVHGQALPQACAPQPSFHRLLTALRLDRWQQRIIEALGPSPKLQEILSPWEAALFTAS